MIDHCYWYSYTFFSVRRNFPSWEKGRREETDCRPISRSSRVTEHRRGVALLLEGRILAGEREPWATLAATEYAKRRSLRARIKIGLMPRARLAAVRPRERRGVPARPLLVITRCKTETRHRRPYDPFQLTESSACCCAQPNRCSGSELSRLASNDHEDELPRSLFLSTVQRAIAT